MSLRRKLGKAFSRTRELAQLGDGLHRIDGDIRR
jgi:hypothetical protein